MNRSFGIFDVFATAIPGSLYLLEAVYVAVRFGWLDLDELSDVNATLSVTVAVLTSYLLGHLLAPAVLNLANRLPPWRPTPQDTVDAARGEFVRRNPTLANRGFLYAHGLTLVAGLRQRAPDAASSVDRNRATGLMLRMASPAFLVAAIISVGEVVAGRFLAVAATFGLVVASGLALREGRKFARWTLFATWENAAWLPDVETRLNLNGSQAAPTAHGPSQTAVDPSHAACPPTEDLAGDPAD